MPKANLYDMAGKQIGEPWKPWPLLVPVTST